MQIDTSFIGNQSILALHGNLVLGKGLVELRSAVRDAAEKHPKKIILNLANVIYVDSCGIGELVSTYTYAKNRGASLVMTNLPKKVRILLDMAKLTQVLGVSDSDRTPNIGYGQQLSLCPNYCPGKQGSPGP